VGGASSPKKAFVMWHIESFLSDLTARRASGADALARPDASHRTPASRHAGRVAGRRSAALVAIALGVALAGCGGGEGGPPSRSPTSPSASTVPVVRFGEIEVVHLVTEDERRLTLCARLDTGEIVMTAIGSDADDADSVGEPRWTPMRQALLVQLRAALAALGWQETGTGPEWYQVRFSGGQDARIPIIESPSTSPDGLPTEAPTEGPTVVPTEEPGGPEVGDLVRLIGRPFADPEVAALVRRCGAGSDAHRSGNIACESEGFELTLGGSGLVVKAITLFNLEYSGYSQYQGQLPLGLSWEDDYDSVLSKLGQPMARLGGSGVEVQLRYRSGDVYVLVTTTATHDNPDYLAGAKIHWIELSVDPVQGYPPG